METTTYKNERTTHLLQLTFKDGDIIHLRPGESLTVSNRYVVIKEAYV